MSMKRYLTLSLLFCLSTLLFGCHAPKDNEVIIGISPSDDSERTLESMEVVTEYFRKQLNMEVSQLMVTNYSAMIEAMRAKKIHVGSGGAFTYLVAADKANAEAIITTGTPDGVPNYYRSCLITRANSPINNFEDLKKNSKSLTLSWAYPTSTSGHLVPRYEMQIRGIFPKDFKEVLTSTDHASAIFTMISGKVDVAAVALTGIERFLMEGRITKGDYKIIWQSEPLLPAPIFVRKDLDPVIKKKIQKAYIDMKKIDPAAWAVISKQYMNDIEYIEISDKDYQYFRDIANKIDDLGIKY